MEKPKEIEIMINGLRMYIFIKMMKLLRLKIVFDPKSQSIGLYEEVKKDK